MNIEYNFRGRVNWKNKKPNNIQSNLPPLNRITIDLDLKLPQGKYIGLTLNDILEINPSYYKWLKDMDLIREWGLYTVNSPI